MILAWRRVVPWLTLALLVLAHGAARAQEPTRRQLRPDVSEFDLRKLTPERRALVLEIAGQMEQDLFYWETFPVELPPTSFGDREDIQPLLAAEELYQSSGDMELEEVARDANGELAHLTEAQLTQVRAQGNFSVPSKRYPGQEHVWEVTTLLQKGQRNIEEDAQQRRADGLRTVMYSIPARIIGKDPVSVRNGLSHIGSGLWGVGSLLIGLPEMRPRYSAYGVEQKLRTDMFRTTLAVLRAQPGDTTHLRWAAPDGTALDFGLFHPELWQRAYNMVDSMERLEAEDWELNAVSWQSRRERELREAGVPEEELPQRLADLAADERQQRLLDALLDSKDLEGVRPGFSKLLVDQLRATRHALTAQAAQKKRLEQRAQQTTAALQAQHPVRARIPEWLQDEVANDLAAYEAKEQLTPYQETLARLQEDHLDAHAWLLQKNLEYQRTQAPRLRAQFSEMKQPSRVFTWDYRVWNPENWKINREVYEHIDGTTTTTCYADPYAHVDATTRWPLWRLGNFTHRTFSWLFNSTYWLLAFNLWNGPVGLKSLFLGDPFLAEMQLNPQTCKLEGDPNSETQTLRSRVGALWTDVRESREEFEAEPDTGFLGKKVSRAFNITWNYGLKGPVGTVLIIGGQPLLTFFNLMFSMFAVVTSVVWVPLASLAVQGFNTLLFDTETPDDDFFSAILPLWGFVLGHVVFAGVGQTVLAGLAALVFEPAGLAIGGVFSLISDGGRRLYDALMYRLIIRPLARVPASDSFTARRIKGPGMSSTIYYQLPSQRAWLALVARMEKEELEEYNRETTELLDQPVEAYNRFRHDVFGPFTDLGSGLNHAGPLYRADRNHRERLQRAVADRRAGLDTLLQVPQKEMIRLTREDLEWTLNHGQVLVRDVYTQRIWHGDTTTDRRKFWAQRKLADNDWDGLTRQFLADTFSQGILEPLGDEDATLRLNVEHPRWQRYLAAVAQGQGPGDDLKKIHVPRKPVKMAPTAARPLVRASDLSRVFQASGSTLEAREPQYRWTPYEMGQQDDVMGPALLVRGLGPEYGLDEFLKSRGIKWPPER